MLLKRMFSELHSQLFSENCIQSIKLDLPRQCGKTYFIRSNVSVGDVIVYNTRIYKVSRENISLIRTTHYCELLNYSKTFSAEILEEYAKGMEFGNILWIDDPKEYNVPILDKFLYENIVPNVWLYTSKKTYAIQQLMTGMYEPSLSYFM